MPQLAEMSVASRWILRGPKFFWGAYSADPFTRACYTCSLQPSIFQRFAQIISCFTASTLMHNYVCLTKAKVFPNSLFAFPNKSMPPTFPVSKSRRTFCSYWSFSSRRRWRKVHISRNSRSSYHLQLQQVCNMCVCMCEHMSACVCIMYMSVCK